MEPIASAMAMTDPLAQLGYQPDDLQRFIAELNLQRQYEALLALWNLSGEDASTRYRRFAEYGRLLVAATSALPQAGIMDLLLDGASLDPTVREAQLLRGGEVLLAEGLGFGPSRPCRFSIPLWIYAALPSAAKALESGWASD